MSHVRSSHGSESRDYSKCDRCEGTGKSRAVLEAEKVVGLSGQERVQAFLEMDDEGKSRMFESNRDMYDTLMDSAYGDGQ